MSHDKFVSQVVDTKIGCWRLRYLSTLMCRQCHSRARIHSFLRGFVASIDQASRVFFALQNRGHYHETTWS